ncbi:lipopolysaccharide biosynthesis protein [Microlunatus flavus]|uniref:Polysaccharide transporter, PST family n=1 Tax=Microlunatus flavus TaxID=1036181 RepID=A0A1H8ZBD7_9ACTN|nr:lipopolysaccharide biosynthesis protein [Microlunatus flavus]SEP61706.1 polysaccharide transporter, PST family [Microlunatus flavus]
MVDLGRAAARGTAFTLGAQGGRFVLQIGSLVVLARLLSPEAFGLVAMATSVLGVAELVRDFGLSSAAIQAKELTNPERTNLFWVNVAIGTTCALVALVGARPIAALYGDPRVAGVVLALAGLLVVSGVTTQFRAELSRDLRFVALGVVELSAQAAGVAVAITAAALGAGYWSIVLQQGTVVLTTCVLCVVFCAWRPGLPSRSTSVRRFVRFGSHVLGTQVLGYATNNVDNVGIGAVWGAGPLGVYSRAYQLLMVPINQINDPMSRVVLPVLSRVQDDLPTLQRYVEKAQRVGTYGLGPAFGVAAGLAAPLVAVLFGPQWTAVVPVFVVLAVGGVFRGVGLVTYWGFLARGRADRQLRMYLLTRPLMIGMILGGLPWGPVGVAVGHSAAFAAYWVVSLVSMGRATGLDAGRLLRQALVALVALTLPLGLLAHLGTWLVDGAVLQLVVGGVLALGWVGLLLAVLPSQRAELAAARGLLRRERVSRA